MRKEMLTKDEQLFLTLVTNFQASAWIRLGKIKDPITDSVAVNLDECKFAIDMLEMLRRRMDGSMTERERSHTQKVLQELNSEYRIESDKAKKAEDEGDVGAAVR